MAISAVAVTVQIRAASRAVARAVGVSFADKFSGAQYVTSVTDGDGTVEALPGPAAGAPEIATTLLTSRQHGLTTRHCSRCRRWVFGLRPWYRPRPGELVTCDHPLAVEVARDILEREKAEGTRSSDEAASGHGARCGLQPEYLRGLWAPSGLACSGRRDHPGGGRHQADPVTRLDPGGDQATFGWSSTSTSITTTPTGRTGHCTRTRLPGVRIHPRQ